MGVKYEVIFKDGQRLLREAVCFGSMAWGDWTNSFGNREVAARPANEQSFIQFYTANNIHPIWKNDDFSTVTREWSSSVSGNERRDANRLFLREMQELVADMPWLQDVITIHPITGVVRAHIKDHKADKIITSLFLIRNIGNYMNQAVTYRKVRNMGYRPRFAAIIAHKVYANLGFGNSVQYSDQYLGEYNWINPQSFGKNAFLKMMGADKDTEFDFIQKPWAEQRGYRRDGYYRNPPPRTNGANRDVNESYVHGDALAGEWRVFDSRYIVAEAWDWRGGRAENVRRTDFGNTSYLFNRNVVDCYSQPDDVGFFDESIDWNPVNGFSVMAFGQNKQGWSNGDSFTNYLNKLEEICTEAGITVRVEQQTNA